MGSGSEEEHHGSMRIATPALIVAVAALLVGLAALGAVTYYRRHKKSATSDTAKEKEEADDVETYENVGSPVYKKPVHRH
nr:hypothetical protein BaRGS_030254 [Batillaria attramentaria]